MPFFAILAGALLAWCGYNGLNAGVIVIETLKNAAADAGTTKKPPAITYKKGSGLVGLAGPFLGYEFVKAVLPNPDAPAILGAAAAGVWWKQLGFAGVEGIGGVVKKLWGLLSADKPLPPDQLAQQGTLADFTQVGQQAAAQGDAVVLGRSIAVIEAGKATGVYDQSSASDSTATLQADYVKLTGSQYGGSWE